MIKLLLKAPALLFPLFLLEQLNSFEAPSISRNPIIAYVFNLMGYAEETGFGMHLLKSLNQKHGLPLREYTFRSPFLKLTFPRTLKALRKVTSHKNLGELTDKEIEGYEWIKSNDAVSAREYSAHFDIGYKTAQRHLTKMRTLNLIGDNGEPINSPKYKYIVL